MYLLIKLSNIIDQYSITEKVFCIQISLIFHIITLNKQVY